MNVTFYNIIKRVNSTKVPVGGGTTYTCVLKDRSSIINPTIAVKMPDAVSQTAPAHNYAYISAYGRYYWVDNWTFEDRQWIASLSVDVLASWKTEIGALSKFIIRTGSDYNNFDSGGPDALFPAGFGHTDGMQSVDIPGWVEDPSAGGSYIVGLIGQDNPYLQVGGASYCVMSATSLSNLIQQAFTSREPTVPTGNDISDAIKALIQNMVKSVLNPADYIASAIWLPYTVGVGAGWQTPYLGFINATNVAAYALGATKYNTSFVVPCQTLIGGSGNKTSNFYVEPYATYYLEFWPFGVFPINGRTLVASTTLGIQIDLTVDQITGVARFEAYRATSASATTAAKSNAYLCGGSAQLGVTLPIGGTKSNTSGAIGTLLSNVAQVSGDSSGSYSVGGSIAQGGTAALNVAAAMSPRAVMGGTCTGFAGISKTVRIHRTQFIPSGIDYTDNGKIYAQTATISNLSGYVQCWDGEISLGGGTLEERRQISGYLTGGFFYE